MRTIIVDCTGFTLDRPVYAYSDASEFQIVAHLKDSEVAKYASANDVEKIVLSGPTEYCYGIKLQIANHLVTEYSNNNIEIEVIEK